MDISFSNSNFHSKAYILSSAINTVGGFPWRKSFPPFIFEENINIPVGLSIILSSKNGALWKKQLVWDHNSNNFTSAIPPDFFAAEVLSAALPFHYRVWKSHLKKKSSELRENEINTVYCFIMGIRWNQTFFSPESALSTRTNSVSTNAN